MRGLLLISLLLIGILATAQTPTQFDFQTRSLPSGSVGNNYTATIQALTGTPPLTFTVTRGKLPPGVLLQPNTGVFSGIPTAAGTYPFTVLVADAVGQRATRDFTINIEDLLSVKWLQSPSLNSNVLSGSVEVSNGSRDAYDLTVVVVAVNEIGKAFALGYQHFNLSISIKQAIPFSSLLPNGRYIVHVDAVGEIAARKTIRRARLQTQQPVVVNVNR